MQYTKLTTNCIFPLVYKQNIAECMQIHLYYLSLKYRNTHMQKLNEIFTPDKLKHRHVAALSVTSRSWCSQSSINSSVNTLDYVEV